VVVAGVILLLGMLISAGSSEAKTTEIDQWAVGCVVYPGADWISDGVLHGRGRAEAIVNYSYDDDAGAAVIVGSGTSISHIELDLATGDADMWGVFSMIYLPLSAEGTFDGDWTANLVGFMLASGWGTAEGTGPVSHSKLRMSMEGDTVPLWLEDELAIRPPPCGRVNASIFHNLGAIRGRPVN
jgi:hypothetical protein